jgi:hypothetical protein
MEFEYYVCELKRMDIEVYTFVRHDVLSAAEICTVVYLVSPKTA